VELFKKERRIGNSTAAPKRSVDCTRTVIVHDLKNMSWTTSRSYWDPRRITLVVTAPTSGVEASIYPEFDVRPEENFQERKKHP